MFYLMLALRAELRERGAFPAASRQLPAQTNRNADHPSSFILHPSSLGSAEPNLADLLPLVALGTVADVVALDRNNRILVQQGLQRIRAGRMQPGVAALFEVAGRDARRATARDLGFVLGPRLNAAGRLTDMALGIEGLCAEDPGRARAIAEQLDRINRERRAIESGMREEALAAVEVGDLGDGYTLCLYDPAWHPGVVGIVAGRIKEQFHRPAIAFARADNGEIRGSGRSIACLHLRDALDRVAVQNPGLILKFGGHAAAAGLTLREDDFERFRAEFESAARSLLTPADLERVIETDGALPPEELTLETVELLAAPAWGPGFPPPRFCGEFEVASQRIVGEQHLKLGLALGRRRFEAIRFRWTESAPARIRAVYHPAVSEYDGTRALQLTLEHWEAA
jgi:single-stranded-DNA-specific exonuclease